MQNRPGSAKVGAADSLPYQCRHWHPYPSVFDRPTAGLRSHYVDAQKQTFTECDSIDIVGAVHNKFRREEQLQATSFFRSEAIRRHCHSSR
jgi:hypothetical protein